jgi:hypothetical protein
MLVNPTLQISTKKKFLTRLLKKKEFFKFFFFLNKKLFFFKMKKKILIFKNFEKNEEKKIQFSRRNSKILKLFGLTLVKDNFQ